MDNRIIEFGEKVKNSLQRFYGDEVCVRADRVMKNNGIELLGVSISSKTGNLFPTIYMESYYRRYEMGDSFSDIFKDIVAKYEECKSEKNFDMSFFSEYENVRERIAFKLINKNMNQELLKDIPYIDFYDLAIVFYYVVECDLFGNATILIHNNHLHSWNITLTTLYEDAKHNTPTLLPLKMENMSTLIESMLNSDSNMHEIKIPAQEKLPKLYVVTNSMKQYGAACLAYDGVLEDIGNRVGADYCILPSSIHEIIIVPASETAIDIERFKEMVNAVNTTQLSHEEILSDSVYFYDRKNRQLLVDQCFIA